MRSSSRVLQALVCLALAGALTAAAYSCEIRPDYFVADGKLIPVSAALDSGSVTRAANRFSYLYETYLEPNHMHPFVAIVPDKGYYLPDSGFDYDALFAQTYAQMEYAEPIDLTGTLSFDSYYATDSHWRQECLADTANTLVSAMTGDHPLSGNLPALSDYTLNLASKDYTGSDWQAVHAGKRPMGRGFSDVQPEPLYYLDSELLQNMTVYNFDHKKITGFFVNEKPMNDNLYNLFLSGPTAILTIDNPAAPCDRRLVVFRDSYGSSIGALLAPCYRQILMVDIRYTMSDRLGEQIDFAEWDGADALFLYSTTLLNRSVSLR